MSRTHLEHAADELAGLLEHTTPAPWRLSSPGSAGARYRALVGTNGPARGNFIQADPANVDAYSGYLVAESCGFADRDLLAAMRNTADHLPDLLRAVAAEDPIEVGRLARIIAAELCPCDEHASLHGDTSEAPNVSPTSDPIRSKRVTPE